MHCLCTKLRDFRGIRSIHRAYSFEFEGKDLSVLMLIGNDSER